VTAAGAENSGGKEVAVREASKKHKGQHDYTHNFWIGCHKVSEGCKNCYMFVAQTNRRKAGWKGVPDPNVVTLVKGAFKTPLPVQKKLRRARKEDNKYKSVFACSYSDSFLPEADAWRDEAWALIRRTPNLIWQISTKRPELIADRLPADWGNGYPNVWLGTSVELKKYLWRLDALRKIPGVLRWADFAPTLEDLMPELSEHIDGIGWVCGGGQEIACSHKKRRPHDLQWTRNIRDLCAKRGIPYYSTRFRGGKDGELLDGAALNAIPPLNPSRRLVTSA